MDFTKTQVLENFHQNAFQDVKTILAEVFDLAHEWGVEEGKYESIWFLLTEIKKEAEYDRSAESFGPISRSVLSMLPVDDLLIVKKFIEHVGLSVQSDESLPILIPETGVIDIALVEQSLKEVFVGKKTIEDWNKEVTKKTSEEQQKIFSQVLGCVELLKRLRFPLELVGAIVRVNSPEMKFLNIESIRSKFDAKITADYTQILGTSSLLLYEDEGKTLALMMMDYCEKFYASSDAKFNWEEAVIFTFFLHSMWMKFLIFGDWEREVLLKRYTFRAELAGVDVAPPLKELLYETYNIVDYLEKNNFLFSNFQQNEETVEKIKVLDLVAGNIEIKSKNQKVVTVLQYLEDVYAKMANAQLIERNHRGEKTEKDLDVERVSKVVEMFLVKDSWEKFAEYYSQENPEVPFARVYNELKENMDLEKDAAVEMLLSFSEFLHEKNILSNDQELIEFHEDDGKFHWNENLTF